MEIFIEHKLHIKYDDRHLPANVLFHLCFLSYLRKAGVFSSSLEMWKLKLGSIRC